MINRNFALLWLGQIISQLGDKFYAIALAWWILQKTNSPSIMGSFLLASALPGLILGFFAGAMTDRWKRQTMLVVTDIIRGCLVLGISYLSMTGVLEIWHVYLVGISLSLATAFFDPAMQAIIPEIVEKNNLTKANGMSQMVGGICTVTGPLLGAIAVSSLGLTWVFLANGISYFISALLAFFMKTGSHCKIPDEKASIWKEILEGVKFVKNQRRIALILVVIALVHFFFGSLSVSLPFLANGLDGSGVNNLGYLEMMLGVGLFAQSAFMSLKRKTLVNERALLLFIMILGLCFMTISISQFLKIETVYAYMPITMIIGACVAGAFVFWQTLLQTYTPSTMTGRVFSLSTLIGNASLPVAYGVFGVLLNRSSIYSLTTACGACLIVLGYYLHLRN